MRPRMGAEAVTKSVAVCVCGHSAFDHARGAEYACERDGCACSAWQEHVAPKPRLLPVGDAFVDPAEVVAIHPSTTSTEAFPKTVIELRMGGAVWLSVTTSEAAKALGLT